MSTVLPDWDHPVEPERSPARRWSRRAEPAPAPAPAAPEAPAAEEPLPAPPSPWQEAVPAQPRPGA
ncbi:MAG TPA: hypothetical protein VNU66_00855, partial [Mycobacteriales bacterium]|nr:hypothetical protein [Mycobacteriales bacterium]